MLTLYNAAHSTCSQKVRLALAEKDLAFTDIRLDIGEAKEHLQPDYLKINPNGVVPTLVDGENIIIDSSVICEYLDDAYSAVRLTPENLVERAHMRTWMRYLEEVPTAAVRVPSFNMAFLPRFKGLSHTEFYAQQSDIRPIRKQFYRRMGPTGFKREDVEASLEQLDNVCQRINSAVVRQKWLVGENYSLADIIAAPLIDRMADLGLSDGWAEQYPHLVAWYERIKVRPAFKRAFYPGSRLSEFLPLTPILPAASGV